MPYHRGKHSIRAAYEPFSEISYHKETNVGNASFNSDAILPTREIEIKKNLYYPLLLLAASIGDSETISLLLENKTIDINRKEKNSMVNAFWVAAFYGRGNAMNQLAAANANVL